MRIVDLASPLELANNSGLSVFFIGTGSAFSKKYYQTNILIIKNEDHLLIDCGTLCSMALHNYGLNIQDVRNFFVSHSHADHIGGLEEVALTARFCTKIRPKFIITNAYKKLLWNESLKGGCAYSSRKKLLTFDDYFEQIKPKKISKSGRHIFETNIGSINAKIFRTAHLPERVESWKKAVLSFGILIDDRLLFTTDSQFDKSLLDEMLLKYPSIEYIFHDCQFYEDGVHASYNQLTTLPQSIKNKMYLCHYGDNFSSINPSKDGFIDFTKQGVFYNLDE
ncbi:MAG: MBL fold metallo-hydrolase [Treponemataceae bacterium]